MNSPTHSPSLVARSAAGLASLAGAYGFLSMMGAFGPILCWTRSSASGTATESGGVTTSTSTVTRHCVAGIDYLLGTAGGNTLELFIWAIVLGGLVTIGSVAAWTGHRHITWLVTGVGVFISIIGLMSIGWYFVLPTTFLLIAAIALTIEARCESDDDRTSPH